MNGFTENNPFFQQALTEHRALHRLLHELEETLAAGPQERTPRRRRELAAQLQRLRAHMAEHFAREEAGGCLEEALSRVPRLGPQVDELEEQHAPLLAQLDAVLAQVSRARQEVDDWPHWAGRFQCFAQALREYEAAENEIVQAACNRDLDLTGW